MKANDKLFHNWFHKKFKKSKSLDIDTTEKEVKVTLTFKKSDLFQMMKEKEIVVKHQCIWCGWKGTEKETDPDDGSCPICGAMVIRR